MYRPNIGYMQREELEGSSGNRRSVHNSPFTIIRRAPILAEKYFSQARSLLAGNVSVAYHTSICS